MAAPSIQATTITRFLVPQLPRSARSLRPAAQSAGEARRYGSYCATSERRRTPLPKLSPLSIQAAAAAAAPRPWQQRGILHTSGHGLRLGLERSFSATAGRAKDHHFDTLKFVQRLKDEGFTEEQAEGMMRVLSDVIEERYVFVLEAKEHGRLSKPT